MIKGCKGDWGSYTMYPLNFFDEVKPTYVLFDACFTKDIKTPLDNFIREKFGEASIWKKLQENARSSDTFKRACMHKLDAFRILQFLKWKQEDTQGSDEENFSIWFESQYPDVLKRNNINLKGLSFEKSSPAVLNNIRDLLVSFEQSYQTTADQF